MKTTFKLIIGIILIVACLSDGCSRRQFSGQTTPAQWVTYNAANGIYVDVDFSVLDLKNPPFVFTSLSGNNAHWQTTGATSIYNLTNRGFRVYVRGDDGFAVTTAVAQTNDYRLNYLVVSRD